MAIKLCCYNDNFIWASANMYGPNDQGGIFWESLSDLKSQWCVLWCFGRDFNMVRFSFEKKKVQDIFLDAWIDF